MKKSYLKLFIILPQILAVNLVTAQWMEGGNLVGLGDFLGSVNNMPLDIHTDNVFRLRVNPSSTSTINTSVVNTTGFVGINTTQPWSYLHIMGPNNTPWAGNGYRQWMRTGTYYGENSDNLYTGLKSMGDNRSDAVWLWGDDSQGAPTNFSRFIFSGAANGTGTCTDCPTDNTGLDGREVMRLAPNGYVGVGPLFETNTGGINSNIHNHMEEFLPIWFQQSNENGTGGLVTDGLRMGIDPIGRAYLKNQKNQPLIFSTDNNTTNQISQERVRITHVNNAETPNPFIFPQDLTRIGISLASTNPVNRPQSLMHLGTNTLGGTPQSAEGWRFWMNNGIYMREQSDNIYVGTKREGENLDRADAIVAWGDDFTEESESNLRFVFASSNGTDPVSQSIDGREVGRFSPLGNLGVGNFYTNGLNEQPTQKVDVDGTARLRQVPASTPANNPHVLITGKMQDINPTTGDYVLNHLAFNGSQTSFLAGDGTWQNGTNVCDWNISGQNLTMGYTGACHTGNVGIGESTPPVKLTVLQENNGSFSGLGGPFFPEAPAAMVRTLASNANNTGVLGIAAQSTATEGVINNVGGHFLGVNSFENNYGISARANSDFEWVRGINSYGVHSKASLAERSFGVHSSALEGDITNYGVYGQASQPHSSNTFNAGVFGAGFGDAVSQYSFGVVGYAAGATSRNASIYGYITPGSTNSYAGYFAGPMISGTPFHPSDEMLKQNVAELEGGLSIINQLYPKTYNYQTDNFIQLGLPEGIQHGFLAQDIAQILPELTNEVLSPPLIDTLGNELAPSVEFLAVNYTGLIPILVSAVKEQQTIIESQNEVLAQMMEQLASMQQQINQCCNANDGTKSMPGGIFQPQDLNNEKSSEGGNELYQNIPNPFRESTTISYQLETGGRVQLAIYDGNGKVVTTLVEANQPNGRHSAIWNANGMPAGVYHYALYVDGELLVKRAIKLQE